MLNIDGVGLVALYVTVTIIHYIYALVSTMTTL